MRILIAHGEGLVFAGVRQALADDDGFDVIGEVYDSADLAGRVSALRPEVVLLDMNIPGVGGLACARLLRSLYPDTRIVMCSMSSDRALIEQAFQAGACGFLLERISAADLGPAIRQAVSSSPSAPPLLPPAPHAARRAPERTATLTLRETDVLEAVARGLSNKAVAAELRVTVQTVKFHLTSIYRKLRVTNRTEATRWALGRGSAR